MTNGRSSLHDMPSVPRLAQHIARVSGKETLAKPCKSLACGTDSCSILQRHVLKRRVFWTRQCSVHKRVLYRNPVPRNGAGRLARKQGPRKAMNGKEEAFTIKYGSVGHIAVYAHGGHKAHHLALIQRRFAQCEIKVLLGIVVLECGDRRRVHANFGAEHAPYRYTGEFGLSLCHRAERDGRPWPGAVRPCTVRGSRVKRHRRSTFCCGLPRLCVFFSIY